MKLAVGGDHAGFPLKSPLVAWLRDQRLARLELYPFQYSPRTGEVRWTRRLVVEVDFTQPLAEATMAYQPTTDTEANPFEASLRATVLNYDIARAWHAKPAAAPQASRP